MKANLLTWAALVLLCLASFLARGGTGLLLCAAGLKCSLLAGRFMELHAAHVAWRVALAALVGGLLLSLGLLAR